MGYLSILGLRYSGSQTLSDVYLQGFPIISEKTCGSTGHQCGLNPYNLKVTFDKVPDECLEYVVEGILIV